MSLVSVASLSNARRIRTYSSRRSTRNLPRRRNNSTELPSRKPGIRDPSSGVLAAWEEVLAGNPSAHRINILFYVLTRFEAYLLLRGIVLALRGGAILALRRSILSLSLRGAVVAMMPSAAIQIRATS